MQPATKHELSQRIREQRELLDATLANVDPGRMMLPGVVGDWSVKDILAHVAVWYARAITLLFQAERGTAPGYGVARGEGWIERLNARDYAAQKDRPLDRIQADFRDSHTQLLKRLESWGDERALFDRQRYPSLDGESLADHVWACTADHEQVHRRELEAWLARP